MAGHPGRRAYIARRIVENLFRFFTGGAGRVANDLSRVRGCLANCFAGVFGLALCFVCRAPRILAKFGVVPESFSFGAQLLRAVGNRLRPLAGCVAGGTCCVFHDAAYAQLFIQLARLSFRRAMQVVKFLFVISHEFL